MPGSTVLTGRLKPAVPKIAGSCRGFSFVRSDAGDVLQAERPPMVVPGAGLEPARSFDQRILSPLRLPIPPPGQVLKNAVLLGFSLFSAFCGVVAFPLFSLYFVRVNTTKNHK
jgi:hypothetical protein